MATTDPTTEREDGCCPDCLEPAEYRVCDECGRGAWIIDCGHYAQPRPYAAGRSDGSDLHHTYCEDCAAADTSPVTITPAKGSAPLHYRYPGQHSPQGAYLGIDPGRRRAGWGVDTEIGGAVPAGVWHRRLIRVPCSCYLTAEQTAALGDELRPLIERVVAGHAVEWNGRNYTGRLDDDASEALDAIAAALEDEEGGVQVWDAGEWLGGGPATWQSLCAGAGVDPERGGGAVGAVVGYVGSLADSEGIALDGTERAVADLLESWVDQRAEID